MKTSFILLFLILHSVTFGQSARKLNRQLRAQFLIEQQKQDSAFALFTQTKREFDSIKRVTNERMDLLSNEEKRALKSVEKTAELSSQLKELGIDPYTIIPNDNPKSTQFPRYREFIRPVKEIMRTDVQFDKVSNRLYLDMMKRKEQNVQLAQKVKEYRDHAKINSISQEDLEFNKEKLFAFFPKLDSLSAYYKAVTQEFKVKESKLESKLEVLRKNYLEKGPRGFPEGYRKVFYDAFPPPASETKEGALRDIHSELVYDEVVAKDPEPEIYEYPGELAVFPGGQDSLRTFISKNLRYPEKFKEAALEGRVWLRFVVSEKGEISGIEVVKALTDCTECSDEAIRMVKLMPNWIPAEVNGKPVKSYGKLIVQFKLQPE